MKKIVYIIASIWLLLLNQVSFALDTQAQKEAELLKSYILRYTQNIQTKREQLHINNNTFLNSKLEILLQFKIELENLQWSDSSYENAEQQMKKIVENLKVLNTDVKSYFEKEEYLYHYNLELSKKSYSLAAQKLSHIIDNFIDKLSTSFLEEKNLSAKQKKIVKELVKMQENSQKLKDFQYMNFDSWEEMKQYLRDIIDNLRENMNYINNLSH